MYRTRLVIITDDGSKSHGYHIQNARVRRTSSWRNICLYPGKNGGCTQITEKSNFRMSRHLDSSTTTQMTKIMVQYGRPSRSSWATSVRSSFGRTIVGKAICENPFAARLGEGFQLQWKILDRYWTKRIFVYRSPTVKTTEYSSSSWSSTSRRWWSDFENSHQWSDEKWKSSMAGGWGRKKIFQYCSDFSGTILYLQEDAILLILHYKTINVFIPDGFFQYIYHVGCAINLHSIINSGSTTGSQNFEQKTDGILSACESYRQRTLRSWEDRLGSSASCTVHAYSMEETSKHGLLGRHQTCSKERI